MRFSKGDIVTLRETHYITRQPCGSSVGDAFYGKHYTVTSVSRDYETKSGVALRLSGCDHQFCSGWFELNKEAKVKKLLSKII